MKKDDILFMPTVLTTGQKVGMFVGALLAIASVLWTALVFVAITKFSWGIVFG